VYATIKILGAAYLILLGVQAFRHRQAVVLVRADIRP
jgi:threonine/homoserine/homoserine lactone efflux protein